VTGFQFQSVVENADPTVTTLALRSGDIDVGAMDARAADIANDDLVRLTDDKGLQPTSGLNVLGFYVTSKTATKYGVVNMSDLTTKR
jgi:glycine betaine/choline ABC-type transport system substrate-binding protein